MGDDGRRHLSLLSAFIHDDAIAGATMDRALAVDLLSEVTGKVHRMASKIHNDGIWDESTAPRGQEIEAVQT